MNMTETVPEKPQEDRLPHHRWPADGGLDLILRRPRQGLIFKKKPRYTDLPLWLAEMMEGYQLYTLGLTLLGTKELPELEPEKVTEAWERTQRLKRHHRLFTPSLDKLYRTKGQYLGWLAREYDRYRAGLELLLIEGVERPTKNEWLSAEEATQEVSEDQDLNQAIVKELEELDRQFATEFALIDEIEEKDWQRIAESESPGLALALFLGAEPELIEQDLSNAASLGLFSRLAGTRTDFASFEGPKAWYEGELGQIHKVVEGVAQQLMGEVTKGLRSELRKELVLEGERMEERASTVTDIRGLEQENQDERPDSAGDLNTSEKLIEGPGEDKEV